MGTAYIRVYKGTKNPLNADGEELLIGSNPDRSGSCTDVFMHNIENTSEGEIFINTNGPQVKMELMTKSDYHRKLNGQTYATLAIDKGDKIRKRIQFSNHVLKKNYMTIDHDIVCFVTPVNPRDTVRIDYIIKMTSY